MPITFSNKQEAKEYQKRMSEEGTETYLISDEDKFEVYQLGKISKRKVIFTQVPEDWMHKKENLGEFGDEEQWADAEWAGKATALYTKKAGTRAKLHELGHARLGHKNIEGETEEDLKQVASDEIDAEIYSYAKMDRPVEKQVGLVAFIVLTDDYGIEPKQATSIVAEELKKRGLELTREELIALENWKWK